ncbi:M-phase phosphoprotein 6-like [Sycon ciliatum]|uniref:M-phase phosphoprotein 6-like n=1 Tax=Sycon ciliatum TaxID=27933 RepID=UPI0020A99915|eukprot:scpid82271/ scgid14102/ M-phase phosphoprotein 6
MANVASPSPKASLSKTILDMKFMQRKKEAEHRKQLEENRQRDINEAHWTNPDSVDGSSVEMGFSYADCEPIEPCARRSFHKFNPAIEKLYRQLKYNKVEEEAMKRENEQAVTEEEMADRYENLVGSIAKKFKKSERQDQLDDVKARQGGNSQRKRKSASDDAERPRKFLKPSD